MDEKQRRKLEAKFTTKLIKWIKNRWGNMPDCGIEVKVTEKGSYPYSQLIRQNHQLMNCNTCKHKVFVYKISDEDRREKPLDIVVINKSAGYYIFQFWTTKRGQKEFFIIDIDDLRHEIKTSKRRSLNELTARDICVGVYNLGE